MVVGALHDDDIDGAGARLAFAGEEEKGQEKEVAARRAKGKAAR